MSAGSAFASGVRAGQNIWNSAVNNAMAGKRMDMLKTQFQFEQVQRTLAATNLTKAQGGVQTFLGKVSPLTNMLEPEQYKTFNAALLEALPVVSLDSSVSKTFDNIVAVINKRTFGESKSALEAERGLLATQYRSYYKGQDFPMAQVGDAPPAIDWPQVIERVSIAKEKAGQKKTLRADDFKVEQEWNEKFPGKRFPTVDLPRLPGEPAPDVPVKDFAAATMLMSQEAARLTEEEAFDVAETKDKIAYRGDFNRWKKLIKNPALDAKKPDDQKLFRTYQHDEQISVLMAEAGLEAFKLSDKLIPDPVSGGYENMAQVTGMINDMIRAQEEEAGLRKEAIKKPLSEAQAKDFMFSGRMMATEQTLAKLEAAGFAPESVANNVGMNWLPEFGKTNAQKRYIAARANWVGAVLRRESGAAIAAHEYEGGFAQYFPLINDSPTVIADKRDLRRQVQRDMRDLSTNQVSLSGYKAVGDPVVYNNIADVEAAVSRGRLKVGDTYKYKTQLGGIQNGVVQPPAP